MLTMLFPRLFLKGIEFKMSKICIGTAFFRNVIFFNGLLLRKHRHVSSIAENFELTEISEQPEMLNK